MTFQKGNKINLGKTPWNKGKKMNDDFCSKVSKNKKGKTFEEIYGDKAQRMKTDLSNFQNVNFTKAFKEAIKIRDYACVICGSSNRLQIHHIDYNKLNTTKENCVALCLSCHMKTNYNRKQWTSFFKSLLNERYNYDLLLIA